MQTVGDGLQAFDLGRSGRFDVLVVDLMLPGIDGLDLCSRLRAAGVDTPVLVLTARTAEQDQLQALRTGADDFLTKPFSYRVLLARLQALVRRTGPRGRAHRRRPGARPPVAALPARGRRHRADAAGVQPARAVDVAARPGRVQALRAGRGVGPGPRRRVERAGGLRLLPPAQGRPALRPAQRPDRPRCRLPAGSRCWWEAASSSSWCGGTSSPTRSGRRSSGRRRPPRCSASGRCRPSCRRRARTGSSSRWSTRTAASCPPAPTCAARVGCSTCRPATTR